MWTRTKLRHVALYKTSTTLSGQQEIDFLISKTNQSSSLLMHYHTPQSSKKPLSSQLNQPELKRETETREKMAYSACFLHQSALASTAARSSSSSSSQRYVSLSKPVQVVCKAQQAHEDDNSAVSRRLALTLLVGAAAVGSKVSPADAAYGEAGKESKKNLHRFIFQTK